MLIVAHAGYPALLDSGADFIEIDVRRRNGVIIDSHDEPKADANHAPLDEIIDAVGSHGIGLHLDLKEAGYEIELLSRVLESLSVDKVVATPDFDSSVRTIKRNFPAVRVSPVDFIAMDQKDATEERLRRITVPVWVWTVDKPRLMRRYFADHRIEALITNRPEVALKITKRRA